MNVLEKRVENQVQFWSLLGPFLILLSVAVLLFKVSAHWYFPLSALVGIPLCVKWKMKGMAAALTCLFSLSLLGYQSIDLDGRFWHVGMAMAMAFSFIILTLSLEEVEGLVGKLQLESQSRLDNFLRLDEKMKGMEQEWLLEKERTQGQVTALTQDIAKTQEDKQTYYKLMQLSKDELIQLRIQHDQLLQELFYKKQQIVQLDEKLEETEATVQSFVNSDPELTIIKLTDRLEEVEKEKELFKNQLESVRQQVEEIKQDKNKLLQDFLKAQEREKIILAEQQRAKKDQSENQILCQKQQEKLEILEKEKVLLQSTLNQVKQQCEYVRNTEGQHQQTIQNQICKIENLEKALETREKELGLIQQDKRDLEHLLAHAEQDFKLRYEELQHQLQQKEVIFEQENQHIRQYHLAQQHQASLQLENLKENLEKTLSQLKHQQNLVSCKEQEIELYRSEAEELNKSLTGCQEAIANIQAQEALAEQVKLKLEEELCLVQGQLASCQEELEHAQANQDQMKLLEQDKLRLEGELAQMTSKLAASQVDLEQAIKDHRQAALAEEASERLKFELRTLQSKLADCQEELDRVKGVQRQFDLTVQSKNQLEIELNAIRSKLADCEEQLKKSRVEHEPISQGKPSTFGNTRKIEAMYLQLKEQFQEKSSVLDDVRKELFRTQEELACLQKDHEEQKKFAMTEEERLLQQELERLSCEYENARQDYEQEIDSMSHLIQDLLQKIN